MLSSLRLSFHKRPQDNNHKSKTKTVVGIQSADNRVVGGGDEMFMLRVVCVCVCIWHWGRQASSKKSDKNLKGAFSLLGKICLKIAQSAWYRQAASQDNSDDAKSARRDYLKWETSVTKEVRFSPTITRVSVKCLSKKQRFPKQGRISLYRFAMSF